ncbi:NUDIX hydrolase [Bacteroidota bacterium]
MKRWKILNKTDVSPDNWFPIERHTVEIHNGKIIDDFYISPLGDGVMTLAFTENQKIILIKQYKHAFGEVTYDLPAGFLQKNKSLKESALAELEEETGIKASSEKLVFLGKFCNVPSKLQHTTHSFLLKNVSFNSVQKLDECEEIIIETVTPKKVLDMIKNQEIIKSDVVATIMMAYLKFPELFV